MSERVMVVERAVIAHMLAARGLMLTDGDAWLDVIHERHFFLDRPLAESSPQYKQIIPYVIIRHDDSFFLLQRTPRQTESRLHNLLSLGIGGHVNPETPELLDGLQKELEEEVGVAGDYDLGFIGMLNDDSTEVGQVHLGAVFLLESKTGIVEIRETDKMTGRWAAREELEGLRDRMETWSQIIYDEWIRPQQGGSRRNAP